MINRQTLMRTCVVLLLIISTPKANTFADNVQSISPAEKSVVMNYGKGNVVKYNLSDGTFDIVIGANTIIRHAYSASKNHDNTITSKDYNNRTVVQQSFSDAFGKGKKYIITSTKSDAPILEQVFYVYPQHGYFFIESFLKGVDLKSNYMAPLISNDADILSNGDNRSLYVPFDNDAFISYNAKSMQQTTSNISAEVGMIYDDISRKGLLLGSVEHGVWKTGVKTNGAGGKLEQLEIWGGFSQQDITRDQTGHGSLSGNNIKSPKILVGYFPDWRTGLEEYGKANRLADPPFVKNWDKPTPFGWNSWGAIQNRLSFDNAYKVAGFFADSLKIFRSGETMYIDLDAFWNDLIPGGTGGDFLKLTEFVNYCKKNGLQAGAYMAPFTDWGWKSGPERKVQGSDYTYGDIWLKADGKYHDFDGGRAIDPTHPATQKNIEFIVNKLKASGFTMMKIDFLGHAAIEADHYYDKNVTTGMQAYREGMEFLTKSLGNNMLIYAAISPSLATGRYVHTRRIACDAFKAIDNTSYTLNSVSYGWWQTYLYNFIDADHIVFGDEPLGVNKARFTSGIITGTLILGDNFAENGQWKQRIKALAANQEILNIPRNGLAFKPIEGNTGVKSSRFFIRKIGKTVYIAAFNFDNSALETAVPLSRLGLKGGASYIAEELYSKSTIAVNGDLHISLEAKDAAIYAIHLK
jgi:alpha-galactosidase